MKKTINATKKNSAKNLITISGYTKSELLAPDVLAYCGYRLNGSQIEPTGSYNPIPYAGLEGVNVQYGK